MKALLATEQAPENIALALEHLSAAPKRLEALCAGRSDEELRQSTDPKQRSVVEIIAHMLHCEEQSAEAITLALLGDVPLVAKIHPERDFGKLYRYDRLPAADLLTYFRIRRDILLNVLNGLKEAQWAQTIREEGKKRHESVYLIPRTIVMHELEHMAEIGRMLQTKSGDAP